jgi:hypothetical protein
MRYAIVAALALALAACDKPAEESQAPAAQVADQSGAMGVSGGPAPQHGMVMSTTIIITNSGSTNTIGWRVTIGAGGEAYYVTGDGPGSGTLPTEVNTKLRADIEAAKPLASLPQEQPCMKPMSFGTKTFIAVGGDQSPDITCPNNDKGETLKDDVDRVVAFLKLRNVPRSQGKELPPQNQ